MWRKICCSFTTRTQPTAGTVLNYYLAHRPMIGGGNVLGIDCPGIFVTNGGGSYYAYITNTTDYENVTRSEFTNQILAPLQTWLNINPTKRPQYVILFLDVPSRLSDTATDASNYPFYGGTELPSVSYQLATATPGWSPLITHINMNGTNDCIGYINKLAAMGSNSPGKLVISASAAGYGNTNYYFDDTRGGYGSPAPSVGSSAATGVLSANPAASIIYSNALDYGLEDHITNGSNVAGYMCWGEHSSLGADYAINREVQWSGVHNGSYLMDTIESYNGRIFETDYGTFVKWFSSGAFGGTNYSNTPIGGVSSVDEPYNLGSSNTQIYFGLWASGKNFGICAWNSWYPGQQQFQAVGDPFVTK